MKYRNILVPMYFLYLVFTFDPCIYMYVFF